MQTSLSGRQREEQGSNGSAVSKDGENIIMQKRKTKEDLKKDGIELKKTEKCD